MFSTYVIQSGYLNPLLHLTSPPNPEHPTWVLGPMIRDTTDMLDKSVFFLEETPDYYHASLYETTKTSFDETGMLLHVDGVLLDTVGAVTESSCPVVGDMDWEISDQWYLSARALYFSHAVQTARPKLDEFWATICAGGRIPRIGIDLNKLFENAFAFDAYVRHTAMPTNQGWAHFYHYAKMISEGRKFAMTEEGSPALVSVRAQPGDNLAVFLGCPIPFVIRPTARGLFRFIGSAHVHGFMDGEALQLDQTHRKTFVLE
ncbi:hypothetical protein H2200_005765 [Cladophialophora chaetospira]|uniref:Uncharacterized protein n=1 Tax=Cladophialophora chaetospira TaxID=386627 RepID=A0AA38XA93_9EURO|nr:hypothetical protein H2200_005765 [Cladophialophora chaetospira]